MLVPKTVFFHDETILILPKEILRRQWLKHGHKELDEVLVLAVFGLEQEVLVVQDDLWVYIFHQDPEGFRSTVDLLVPLEVWSDCQLHTQRWPAQVNNLVMLSQAVLLMPNVPVILTTFEIHDVQECRIRSTTINNYSRTYFAIQNFTSTTCTCTLLSPTKCLLGHILSLLLLTFSNILNTFVCCLLKSKLHLVVVY